ncbi:MAG: hypothetical protein FWE63_07505 [Bacteroidales bacterium]|nr:hypothetical protein [Bacteroidales bacterium]
MKRKYLLLFISMFFIPSTFAQKLNLNELIRLHQNNLAYAMIYLGEKNWKGGITLSDWDCSEGEWRYGIIGATLRIKQNCGDYNKLTSYTHFDEKHSAKLKEELDASAVYKYIGRQRNSMGILVYRYEYIGAGFLILLSDGTSISIIH